MNLSFWDRFTVVTSLLFQSPLLLCAFLIVCAFIVILFLKVYHPKKIYNYFIPALLCFFFLFLLIFYFNSVVKVLDYLIDEIFLKTYFPSITVYFFLFIFQLIVSLVMIFSPRIRTIIKSLTIVFSGCLQMLFCEFLSVISMKHLDITNWHDLYQTKEILSILEMTTILFIFWVLFLMVIYLLHKIKTKVEPEVEKVYVEKAKYELEISSLKKVVSEVKQQFKQKQDEEMKQYHKLERKCEFLEQLLQRKDQYYMEQMSRMKQNINSRGMVDWMKKVEDSIEKQNQRMECISDHKIHRSNDNALEHPLHSYPKTVQIKMKQPEQMESSEIEIIDFE